MQSKNIKEWNPFELHMFNVWTIIMQSLNMKTAWVTDYTNQTPLSIWDGKMSKFNSPENEKYIDQMCIK